VSAYLRQVRALFWKDLVVELRSRESITASLVFALLVLAIFNFAIDVDPERIATVAPGMLWVTITFAGTLTLGRAFARERDRRTLEGLLLAPVDRSALYLAKLGVVLLAMLVLEAAVLPVFLALFGSYARVDLPRLLLVLPLGALGYAGVGTLFAAVAAHTRAREVMLPVLLFPVQVPLILAAVKTTAAAMPGPAAPVPDTASWLGLLVAFDVLFLALSVLLFEYAIESD
jgi:heme exporter protein B